MSEVAAHVDDYLERLCRAIDGLPRERLAEVASYDVPTTLVLENQQTKRTTIWTLRAD